ncbi:MAG: cph2 8 [Frankiales bacterium]|nr:cph2 8 [Frankiales bacterium]
MAELPPPAAPPLTSSGFEQSTEELYEDAPCGYVSTATDGTVVRANATLLGWLGVARDDLVQVRRFQDLLSPGHRVLWQTHHQQQLLHKGALSGVRLELRADGRPARHVLLSASLVDRPGGRIVRLTLFDATERQAYERSLVAARNAAEVAEQRLALLQQVSALCAEAHDQHELATAAVAIAGEALLAAGVALWTTGADGALHRAAVLDLGEADAPLELPADSRALPAAAARERVLVRVAGADGVQEAVTVAVPLVSGPELLGVLAVHRARAARGVLSDEVLSTVGSQLAQALTRSRMDAELRRLALHDALTGLPNRALFSDRAELALARAEHLRTSVAVLVVDLDGFKHVNDTLGHQAGDELLQEVGQRLRQATRPQDSVARVGGDEFFILCEDLTASQAEHVASRVREAVAQPVLLTSGEVRVSASIGLATHLTGRPEPVADLLARADAAMYQVKRTGKNNWASSSLGTVVRRQAERDLRAALRDRALELHYQPVFDLVDGRLVGLEALSRVRGEGGLVVAPNEFLPIAQSLGLLPELGTQVLRAACAQAVRWRETGHAPGTLSVNVAAEQAGQADFADVVLEALDDSGWAPDALVLEVTESALLDASSSALRGLRRLRDVGIGLALDDFGTGFASLKYVHQFPFTELKIDQTFVAGLPSPRDRAIVRAVAGLASDMGWDCVAEGVETPLQLSLLRDLGLRGQGHLLGRPAPAEDTLALLQRAG